MMQKAKPIIIAGCGPGHPDYVCPIVKKTAEEAEVLVGAPHLLDMFSHVRCERIEVRGRMDPVLEEIEAMQGRQVCVLVSGDTGVYSLAQLVIGYFGRANCQVLPGVSSVQLAFSRLALGWSDALLVSAHGRTPALTYRDLYRHDKIAVLAGTNQAVSWCAEQLTSLGDDYLAVSCEDLTLPTEQVQIFSGAEELMKKSFSTRTILLLLKKELLA